MLSKQKGIFLCIFIAAAVLSSSCQPQPVPSRQVIVLDGTSQTTVTLETGTIQEALAAAGLAAGPSDRALVQGNEISLSAALPQVEKLTLQIRRARKVVLLTPDGRMELESTAGTVGEVLAERGLQARAADYIEPAPATPLFSDLTIHYRPARDITVDVDQQTLAGLSAAASVGQALAGMGLSLNGLDYSIPDENADIPTDGLIRIIRVNEKLELVEKSLPYRKNFEYRSDLAVGTQKVIEAGENGLSMSRVRIRYENGVEISRVVEAETLVRPPKDGLIAIGSQAVVQSLEIPGGKIQYWRAVQMYATSYSPCRSGTSKCSYGTASGIPVKQGVVAMVRSIYSQLAGSQVYIPGYGMAVIADVGGGFPDGRLWIDLGYSDEDYQNWSGFVTVYFLVPAPANIPPELQ